MRVRELVINELVKTGGGSCAGGVSGLDVLVASLASRKRQKIIKTDD